jgi:hypothetical protein
MEDYNMLYKAMHKLDKFFLETKGIKGEWDLTLKFPKDCELFVKEHGEEFVESHEEDVAVTFLYGQFTYYLFFNVFEKHYSFAGFHGKEADWDWLEVMFENGIRKLNGV